MSKNIKNYLRNHKEYRIGRHYLMLGYNLKYISFMFNVSRYGVDISFYPFFFQFEYHGVDMDDKLINILGAKSEAENDNHTHIMVK